jgi:hypothetical protein
VRLASVFRARLDGAGVADASAVLSWENAAV